MKDKLIVFVVGLLVGSVISTGAFYVYTTPNSNCDCKNNNTHMNGGHPPKMNSGENNQNGQPPEKPSDEKGQLSEKSEDNNSQNNN